MNSISLSNSTYQKYFNSLGSFKITILALLVTAIHFLPPFLPAQNHFQPAELLLSAGSEPLVVINTNDSGPGTLRQALLDAYAHTGPDTIRFAIPTSDPGFDATLGVWIIKPQSGLPSISDNGTVIDGFSQKAIAGDRNPEGPEICIDGSTIESIEQGFRIISAENVIAGLVISGFKDYGVWVWGSSAQNNWIWGNYIGTNAAGTDALANEHGILIANNAEYNVIGGAEPLQGNLISGNNGRGCDVRSGNNWVIGNIIGTDRAGSVAVGNGEGIFIGDGAKANRIGGRSVGERNIISGNGSGITIADEGTSANIVIGNFIGTDINGTLNLGNNQDGVRIFNTSANIIGGLSLGEENVISGNGRAGVFFDGSGAKNNQVLGNLMGTDVYGTSALGNSRGIWISAGVKHNKIGPGNIVSGNLQIGILIEGVGADSNTVSKNWVGLDITGQNALPNQGSGIQIAEGARYNLIGGQSIGDRNIVAGNTGSGLVVVGDSTGYNAFQYNYSGTDASGTRAVGNLDDGAYIENGLHNIFEKNLLSGNGDYGITLKGTSSANVIKNNKIGVQSDSTKLLPNTFSGVLVRDYATANIIGPGNQISYHPVVGIHLLESTVNRITITQNSIKGNKEGGIRLSDGANNSIITPVIIHTSTIAGTAAPNCTIEVFSDSSDQGYVYEGSTIADGSGNWTYTKPVSGPKVTVTATDKAGNTSEFSNSYFVSVKENTEQKLIDFFLTQNYPNPFNSSTQIKYSLPMTAHVVLKVFDVLGHEVKILKNNKQTAGTYSVQLDGEDLSSGLYFYILQADKFTARKKMILIK